MICMKCFDMAGEGKNDSEPLQSFIPVQNDSDFPIQNLPYGVFQTQGSRPRIGVAIGEYILDLSILAKEGYFNGPLLLSNCSCFCEESLNAFMALGRAYWLEARATVSRLLSASCPTIRDNTDLRSRCLILQQDAKMLIPAVIGDYTDFYSSKDHATNVGIMFRGKDNALPPNWLSMPIGYHGRASSVVVSGTDIPRPRGQVRPDNAAPPTYAPCRVMDFELEMGLFIGPGNSLGKPIDVNSAREHIFGLVLVNDWSARDVQKWEYVPLGPFNAKNFATSISPWVVTLDALGDMSVPAPVQDPPVPDYLQENVRRTLSIDLEVLIQGKDMESPAAVTKSNFKYLYWTMEQQIAHHTSTGCNLRPGDMLASGTISGPVEESLGCLLELSWQGTREVKLGSSGQVRKFLQDEDCVIMRAHATHPKGYRVGFGECRGRILPTIQP
mmetsp:Transcript_8268/g.13935  ORF Transcript_8268/g.13935 Transcript_8268/m.13935 type:complete len:442 (+) Transcript_8268:19-1344(+)